MQIQTDTHRYIHFVDMIMNNWTLWGYYSHHRGHHRLSTSAGQATDLAILAMRPSLIFIFCVMSQSHFASS